MWKVAFLFLERKAVVIGLLSEMVFLIGGVEI